MSHHHEFAGVSEPALVRETKLQFICLPKDEARRQIQGKIDNIVEALHILNARRNELAPIHALPNELLTQILTYAKDALEDFPSLEPYTWLKLCWVCRRWRNVLLHSQVLWTSIEASHIERSKVFLERSGTASVSFHLCSMFKWFTATSTPLYIELMHQHANHITSLHISIVPLKIVKVLIDEIGSIPFSKLRHLRLRWNSMFSSPEPLPEFAFNYPKMDVSLRTLELRLVAFLWKPFSGTGLRRLFLRNDRNQLCPSLDLDNFLDILNGCPQLEELCLFWQGPTSFPTLSHSRPTRVIKLEKLTKLFILNNPVPISHILTHLDLPPSVKLRLFCALDSNLSDIHTLIPRANSPKPMSSVETLTLEEVFGFADGLHQPWDDQRIQFLATSSDVSIKILFRPDDDSHFESWREASAMLFRCIPSFYPLAPLVYINVHFDYANIMSQDWYNVLIHYSSTIQGISVSYHWGIGISENAILAFLEVMQAPNNEMGPVVCPRLRILGLTYVHAGDSYADALANCLRSRAERGCKLQHIVFDRPRDWYGAGHWVCPDLTEFVEKVDYLD